MPAVQTDEGEIAGTIVEAALYGVLTSLTIGSLWILLHKKQGCTSLNYPFIFTSVLLFVLATGSLAVDSAAVFQFFLEPMDRDIRIANVFNTAIKINAAKHAIFFATMVVGDAISIYRCWVVWGHQWVIIVFPICCCVVSGVLSYITIYDTQHPGNPSLERLQHHPWVYGIPIFLLSIVGNGLATCLVAFRIWQNERQWSASQSGLNAQIGTNLSSSSRSSLLPIARIIIESGILNTAYLIVYTVVLRMVEKAPGGVVIVGHMATPLVGIIFSLVIVRVEWNRTHNPASTFENTGSARSGLTLTFRRPDQSQKSENDEESYGIPLDEREEAKPGKAESLGVVR